MMLSEDDKWGAYLNLPNGQVKKGHGVKKKMLSKGDKEGGCVPQFAERSSQERSWCKDDVEQR